MKQLEKINKFLDNNNGIILTSDLKKIDNRI